MLTIYRLRGIFHNLFFVYFVFIKEAIGTRDSMNLPRSSAQALGIIRFFKKTFYCYIVYLEKHYSNV